MEYNVQFPALNLSFKINPVAFSINDFNVYWYGIIIGCAFLLALIYALARLKDFGIKSDSFFDCVLAGLIGGIVGARLYYVIFNIDYYINNPAEIFAVHNGGLAIYGGIIGGLLCGCTVAKIRRINIPAILDVAALGFLIGQGIGRWGNFMNQEAFGTETNLPWGMLSENTDGLTVHPCFLYESLWCILGFVLLHIFSKKLRKYDGQIFLMYIVWYGLERAVVEGLRTDSLYLLFFDIRVSQLLAIVTAAAGIVLLIIFGKRTKRAAASSSAAEADPESSQIIAESKTDEVITDISSGDSDKSDSADKNEKTPESEINEEDTKIDSEISDSSEKTESNSEESVESDYTGEE